MPPLSTEQPPKKAKKRKLSEPEKPQLKKKTKNGSHSKQNGKNSNGIGKNPTNSNSNNLRSVFARVAERRQKEITLLEPVLLRGFLMDIRELTGKELPSLVAAKSSNSAAIKASRVAHDVRMLINAEYKKMSDEEMSPDKRRKSWQIVKEIFRRIDMLTGKDDDDDDGNDEAETREHGIQTTKPMAQPPQATNGPLLSENGTESGMNPNAVTKQTEKATGKTQTNGSEKAAVSGKANSQSSATPASASTSASQQNSTTATSASKNLNTSDKSAIDSAANNGAKSSSTSVQKKAPARTVASLSSASAMTTAIALAEALGNNNTSKTTVNGNSTLPNKQSVPAGKAPPPYQKHSAVAQQYMNEKLQKQHGQKKDGVRPPTATESLTTTSQAPNKSKEKTGVVPKAAAVVSSSNISADLPASSNTNTNGKVGTRPDPAATKASNPIPEVTKETEMPIDLKAKHKITLGPDDINKPTKYGGFIQHRPRVELQFNHHEPTMAMSKTFQRRLEKWDPYWKAEKNFCIGVTSPVTGVNVLGKTVVGYQPNMAALFISKDLVKKAGPLLRQNYSQQPLHNERRILIRMLPLWISKQKNMGKDRADVHLWPKGTYLQILLPNGNITPMPQEIQQRKQQSHDASKWLGICRHLDVTSQVHKTFSSTSASLKRASIASRFELGHYENTPYMFSLALCRYQSPQTLCQVLLDPHSSLLRRVGLDEMHQRVKKIMESNEVILDGDSDDDDNQANAMKEQKSIRFSIRDPIQRVVLQNPVRGCKCLHISCFDLASYLDINKTPSGQRWKCGHCETFLSYEDLELCALTEEASNQFGAQMDFLQNMVEIKEDRSMSLCKPVRSHQERARAKAAAAGNNASQQQPSQAGGGAQEVVELLDSDSD